MQQLAADECEIDLRLIRIKRKK